MDFTGGIRQRIDIGDLKLDAEKRSDVKKLYHLLDIMRKQGDFLCCSLSSDKMVSHICNWKQGKKVCKATATRCAFCFCLLASRGSDRAKRLKQKKKELQCSVVNSARPL